MKILTIGGATQDITFHTKEGVLVDNKKDLIRQKLLGFEFGAKINIKNTDFTFGGGAANSAVALAKLGNQVSSLICVGNDMAGDEILKNLKEYKIKTNLVQYSDHHSGLASIRPVSNRWRRGGPSSRSGLSFVVNAERLKEEHVLFTYRGANEDLKIDGDELAQHKFDLIYLSSLSGRNAKNTLTKVFRYKNKIPARLKTKIAWNPGNEQIKLGINYLKTYLKNTDIFIVNKDEAIEICLSGSLGNRLNNPRNLLKILSKFCPGVVVITDGSNGAYAWYEMQDYYEPSCQLKVKDTTGVGDAFGSTFSWALLYTNYDIQKSLNLAIKNACSVLKQVGAQNGLLDKNTLINADKTLITRMIYPRYQ